MNAVSKTLACFVSPCPQQAAGAPQKCRHTPAARSADTLATTAPALSGLSKNHVGSSAMLRNTRATHAHTTRCNTNPDLCGGVARRSAVWVARREALLHFALASWVGRCSCRSSTRECTAHGADTLRWRCRCWCRSGLAWRSVIHRLTKVCRHSPLTRPPSSSKEPAQQLLLQQPLLLSRPPHPLSARYERVSQCRRPRWRRRRWRWWW